jgi:hypothetical protein
MNTAEIDLFSARMVQFINRGLTTNDSEVLADQLVQRDRGLDNRCLCMECVHLSGAGRWRCQNSTLAEVAKEGLAPALVRVLQRCPGFSPSMNSGQLGAHQ